LKNGLIRGVASLEGDNLVDLFYLSADEIWSDKRATFDGSGLISGGTTILLYSAKNQYYDIILHVKI
jgi:hypothetical protein